MFLSITYKEYKNILLALKTACIWILLYGTQEETEQLQNIIKLCLFRESPHSTTRNRLEPVKKVLCLCNESEKEVVRCVMARTTHNAFHDKT